MAIWGQTTFTEFVGDRSSPDEQYSLDMARVVRKLDVIPGTLAARQQAVADFLGYNQVVFNGPTGARYISRGTPLPYTFGTTTPSLLPAAQYLYASNITRTEAIGPRGTVLQNLTGGPVGQASGVGVGGNFARARLTVEFTPRLYDVKPDSAVLAVASNVDSSGRGLIGNPPASPIVGFPDEGQEISGPAYTTFPQWPPPSLPKFSTRSRYIYRTFKPGSQLRVLPWGMMQFASDAMNIREGSPIYESCGPAVYQWNLVPESGVPFGAIQATKDCVNLCWFDGFPPGTLLFKDMDMRRFIGPLGDVLYTIEYKFAWRPNRCRTGLYQNQIGGIVIVKGFPLGWNSQPRLKKIAGNNIFDYDFISDGGNPATPPLAIADFSALFRPDQT